MMDERSSETRALAEQALVRLLDGGQPTTEHLIVLGGLVPPTLTGGSPDVPDHLGTTDVDVLLVTHLTADQDLSPVENALLAMAFTPEGDGWRWRGRIDGRVVRIEFLCDLETARAEEIVTPRGCTTLSAVNLRGTGSVEADYRDLVLPGPNGDVRVKFAGLGGYVLAKLSSARDRGADKDYYDLVYVLLYNDRGGPSGAASAITTGALRSRLPGLKSTLVEVRERFADDRALGSRAYAAEAMKVTPEEDQAMLAADATAAVAEFLRHLQLD